MVEPEAPVVEAANLRKEYGTVTAVDGVSFDIQAGEIFALVGPNGAGKTTTVEMLECLRTPTGGTARILGHSVTDQPRAVKRHIGVVPQSFETFERLTVAENVRLIRGLYDEGRAVMDVLSELGLEDCADTRFSSLSGGLQRRTGIAMAMVSDPAVLFLDEPTTGLDPGARRQTWGQIERLTDHGTTVVLTTHYMDEVEELADRAALLVGGSLVAVDTVDALVERYGGVVRLTVEAVDGPGQAETILEETAGDVFRTDGDTLVGVFDNHERAQAAFARLNQVAGDHAIELTSAGMEEVFLRLAGEHVAPGGTLR